MDIGSVEAVRRSAVIGVCLALVVVVAAIAVVVGRGGDALRLVRVADGFRMPVQVVAAPGSPEALYVVEKAGLVRVVVDGTTRAQPFLDIRGRVATGEEQGLLGLAFAPDYVRSHWLIVDFTDRNGDTRVVRYRSNGTRVLFLTARQLLFVHQPYANHNGGMVAYGKDGLVYVGMGDGGSAGDPGNRAQNPAELLGKILRLDPSHPGSAPVMVGLGVRNPWRFSFDRTRGDLWVGDVGQSSVEEVDHVSWPWRGQLNFGWDAFEGRSPFDPKPLGPGRLVKPVAQYSHEHGCSITGGYVYRGSAVPAAYGRYFFGDYCGGSIWSLKREGGGASPIRVEPFLVGELTSFGEDDAGELYLVSGEGMLYRLSGCSRLCDVARRVRSHL